MLQMHRVWLRIFIFSACAEQYIILNVGMLISVFRSFQPSSGHLTETLSKVQGPAENLMIFKLK